MKKIISTKNAPAAIGPYSQGIETEKLIFVSGQLPVNPESGEMPGNIVEQTHQSLKNIKSILEAQGASMDNVIKTTIFINDMNNFKDVNEVYAKYFNGGFPARSCVEVSKLPKDALVEVEAIAVK